MPRAGPTAARARRLPSRAGWRPPGGRRPAAPACRRACRGARAGRPSPRARNPAPARAPGRPRSWSARGSGTCGRPAPCPCRGSPRRGSWRCRRPRPASRRAGGSCRRGGRGSASRPRSAGAGRRRSARRGTGCRPAGRAPAGTRAGTTPSCPAPRRRRSRRGCPPARSSSAAGPPAARRTAPRPGAPPTTCPRRAAPTASWRAGAAPGWRTAPISAAFAVAIDTGGMFIGLLCIRGWRVQRQRQGQVQVPGCARPPRAGGAAAAGSRSWASRASRRRPPCSTGGRLKMSIQAIELSARPSCGTAAAPPISARHTSAGTARRAVTAQRRRSSRWWKAGGGSASVRARCCAVASSLAWASALRTAPAPRSSSVACQPSWRRRSRDQCQPSTASRSSGSQGRSPRGARSITSAAMPCTAGTFSSSCRASHCSAACVMRAVVSTLLPLVAASVWLKAQTKPSPACSCCAGGSAVQPLQQRAGVVAFGVQRGDQAAGMAQRAHELPAAAVLLLQLQRRRACRRGQQLRLEQQPARGAVAGGQVGLQAALRERRQQRQDGVVAQRRQRRHQVVRGAAPFTPGGARAAG